MTTVYGKDGLKPEDRIVIWAKQANEAHGTIREIKRFGNAHMVVIDWDDGERTSIHSHDLQNVTREIA